MAAAAVVDLGCGLGRDALLLASRGHNVLGIDQSAEMLRRARDLAPKAHYLRLDARSLGDALVEGSVDGIWARDVLRNLPFQDVGGVLQGLSDATRDGGVLFASFDVPEEEGEAFDVDGRYAPAGREEGRCDSRSALRTTYTVAGVTELLTGAGWEVAEMEQAEDSSKVYVSPRRAERYDRTMRRLALTDMRTAVERSLLERGGGPSLIFAPL